MPGLPVTPVRLYCRGQCNRPQAPWRLYLSQILPSIQSSKGAIHWSNVLRSCNVSAKKLNLRLWVGRGRQQSKGCSRGSIILPCLYASCTSPGAQVSAHGRDCPVLCSCCNRNPKEVGRRHVSFKRLAVKCSLTGHDLLGHNLERRRFNDTPASSSSS